MNNVTIIGTKIAESKTNPGRYGTTIYYSKPFSDYDEQNGSCVGFQVASDFTYADIGVSNLKPGDVVTLYYDKGFGDKAQLVGYQMVKAASSK